MTEPSGAAALRPDGMVVDPTAVMAVTLTPVTAPAAATYGGYRMMFQLDIPFAARVSGRRIQLSVVGNWALRSLTAIALTIVSNHVLLSATSSGCTRPKTSVKHTCQL
jgi:hypothetical protein